ncbi:shikimate dehydrogenase [Novosphingobium sp. SG707]|uniref:shikimate dehydrogenase n=1 Tax=Novosphingobium sp. SG707 TaxID=2586996 RepID=UPI0014474457|nr:shikimate dehydrogenase [Novosphingobium sp. SG707]NKJ01235.1 shikimate dehydrogenase [Novosphingobium sp. SG707]
MTHASSPVSSHAVGLIGRGIGASRSPAIHEAEARALGLPLTYRLFDFDVMGWEDEDLGRAVRLMRDVGYSGGNVTFPFKQQVIAHCDELSDEARVLGAVNTLVFRDGRVRGENTDWIGFSWLVERAFGSIAGARVAQIGTGGAGSATALALAQLGAGEVVLFDPEAARAARLADSLSQAVPACRFTLAQDVGAAIAPCAGVVNATPVGMAKLPGVPFDPALMRADQWLTDIIYFPLETELLAAARAQGQRVANGVSMVVGQAAEAIRHITGIAPDRERMLARLLADIAGEQAA